jgi:hypothetical protein
MKAGGLFFSPPPSVFDFCIVGILFSNFLQEEHKKQIFFVFYTIFLLCMTFIMRQKRDYESIPLVLFVLSGFIGVFTHSFLIYKSSICFQYLNFYLLSEGFLYILFGAIFLIIAVRYSKNLKFILLLLPFVFYPYLTKITSLKSVIQSARFTIIFSGLISYLFYYFIRKKYKIAIPILLGMAAFAMKYWDAIKLKFICRPDLWKVLILKIKERPFIGHGFNKTLSPDNMTLHSYWGWLYNHNDYLALGSYLGIFSVIFVISFILVTLKKIGINPYLPLFLMIVIVPFFQMTMFEIDKAAGFLLITILCITQTHFKKEAECLKNC